MTKHKSSATAVVAITTAEARKYKRARPAPTPAELDRALEHADLIAPPDDAELHYMTPGVEAQRASAHALGALAAEVRSLQAQLRSARRARKAGAR